MGITVHFLRDFTFHQWASQEYHCHSMRANSQPVLYSGFGHDSELFDVRNLTNFLVSVHNSSILPILISAILFHLTESSNPHFLPASYKASSGPILTWSLLSSLFKIVEQLQQHYLSVYYTHRIPGPHPDLLIPSDSYAHGSWEPWPHVSLLQVISHLSPALPPHRIHHRTPLNSQAHTQTNTIARKQNYVTLPISNSLSHLNPLLLASSCNLFLAASSIDVLHSNWPKLHHSSSLSLSPNSLFPIDDQLPLQEVKTNTQRTQLQVAHCQEGEAPSPCSEMILHLSLHPSPSSLHGLAQLSLFFIFST